LALGRGRALPPLPRPSLRAGRTDARKVRGEGRERAEPVRVVGRERRPGRAELAVEARDFREERDLVVARGVAWAHRCPRFLARGSGRRRHSARLCEIPPLVLGYPKNSSKFSTAVKSNSFPTTLGPSVLASRVLDD